MNQFRLLTKTRQVTEYSCGACALQAVLAYWGKEADEHDLMRLLNTTSAVGTYPEDIVRGARGLGFEAELRENLTLDEVARFTAQGHPMIALAQVWLSEKQMAASVADEWDTGHYIVVLGVDSDYVYFQDPYANMGKAFMPRSAFEDHWHQVMGGDLEKNPKLIHLGIFIRGDRPAEQPDSIKRSFSSLDFQRLGSLNLIVVEFNRLVRPYDFLADLKDIWMGENIRPDAFIFVRKDKAGRVMAMEGGRLQDGEDIAPINALLATIAARATGEPEDARSKAEAAAAAAAAGDFGLSAGDIQKVARKLAPDHTAIIVLFEHVWERKLKAVVDQYGAKLVRQQHLSSDALVKAAGELGSVGGETS